MGLGNNRDYKTRARRITLKLKAHDILTNRNLAEGMSKEDASKTAYQTVKKMTEAACAKLIQEQA